MEIKENLHNTLTTKETNVFLLLCFLYNLPHKGIYIYIYREREREREGERNNISVMENYAKNGRENIKFIEDGMNVKRQNKGR